MIPDPFIRGYTRHLGGTLFMFFQREMQYRHPRDQTSHERFTFIADLLLRHLGVIAYQCGFTEVTDRDQIIDLLFSDDGAIRKFISGFNAQKADAEESIHA